MTLYVVAIGMNYTGTGYALKGCINDAKSTCEMLKKKYGATSDNIYLMTDDLSGDMFPSPANVKAVMHRILGKAKSSDMVYFHISGHGFNIKGGNSSTMTTAGGRISAGLSQCVMLRSKSKEDKNIDVSNTMCDNEFNNILALVPPKMRMFCVIDTCNSGSVFELAHNVRMMKQDTCPGFCPIPSKSEINYYLTHNNERQCYRGDIVILSSVKTKQVAWDTTDKKGNSGGAFTNLYLELMLANESKSMTPLDLLYKLDIEINKKYSQDPCLSFCNIELINRPFFI